MFKEERRGSLWPFAAALGGFWLIAFASPVRAEVVDEHPVESPDAVIATDMDEPSELRPEGDPHAFPWAGTWPEITDPHVRAAFAHVPRAAFVR